MPERDSPPAMVLLMQALEFFEVALRQERLALRGVTRLGLERRFCGDSKDGGAGAELLPGRLIKVLPDRLDLLGVAEIGLLEDEQDVLLPAGVDEIDKGPCRGAPGIGDRENEENQIGHRDEFLGDALVVGDHGVGAGGIDDIEVAQETVGPVALGQVLVNRDIRRLGGVFEEINAICGRDNVSPAEVAAKEGVEDGGFAGFDLAHDHEQERLAQAGIETLKGFDRLRCRLEIVGQRAERIERRAELSTVLEVSFADHAAGILGELK